MKRLIAGSLLVLRLVFGALGAVGYAKYRQIQIASSMPPPPESPVAVATVPAVDQPYRRNSVVIGTVLASQSVTLRNELTGVVTEVTVSSDRMGGELHLVAATATTAGLELQGAPVKAVTYHDLDVAQLPTGRWRARLYFDT